jgi:hypothetical protein
LGPSVIGLRPIGGHGSRHYDDSRERKSARVDTPALLRCF